MKERKKEGGKRKIKRKKACKTHSLRRRTTECDLWTQAVNYNGLKKRYLNGSRPRFVTASKQAVNRESQADCRINHWTRERYI
jgi:hypothetical protein